MNVGESENFKNDTGLEVFLYCDWFRLEPTCGKHITSVPERSAEPHLSDFGISICLLIATGYDRGVSWSWDNTLCLSSFYLVRLPQVLIHFSSALCKAENLGRAHLFLRCCLLCAHLILCSDLPFQWRIISPAHSNLQRISAHLGRCLCWP